MVQNGILRSDRFETVPQNGMPLQSGLCSHFGSVAILAQGCSQVELFSVLSFIFFRACASLSVRAPFGHVAGAWPQEGLALAQ